MLAYLFVAFAIAVRFFPHPWSFTPVAAALLFFGARGSKRQLWVPFALLAVSDLILNKFVYSYPFSWDQLVVWLWYAATLGLGTTLRNRLKPLPIVGASLASSVSFFLLSNFAVWLSGTMYPMTRDGLVTCFTLAVPFFRHTVEGDLLFTAAMFASPALLALLSGALGKSEPTAAS